MKKLQAQLKTVAKTLATLMQKVESVAQQLEEGKAVPAKAKPAKAKAKTAKAKPAKAKPAKAKTAKAKTVKTPAAAVKKPAAKADAAAGQGATVLDSVYDVIKKAKNGANIDTLKKRTALQPRQLSNALYKLTKKGLVEARSRGVYFKK